VTTELLAKPEPAAKIERYRSPRKNTSQKSPRPRRSTHKKHGGQSSHKQNRKPSTEH